MLQLATSSTEGKEKTGMGIRCSAYSEAARRSGFCSPHLDGAQMEVAQSDVWEPLRTKKSRRWLATAVTAWNSWEKAHDLRLLPRMRGKNVECVPGILALQRAV